MTATVQYSASLHCLYVILFIPVDSGLFLIGFYSLPLMPLPMPHYMFEFATFCHLQDNLGYLEIVGHVSFTIHALGKQKVLCKLKIMKLTKAF